MKTIKEHLMEADRNVLLTMLASRYVYEPENLKKNIWSIYPLDRLQKSGEYL